MTKAIKRLNFEEYLTLEDLDNLPEGRCELIDGEFVELPPESGLNAFIATYLLLRLVEMGVPFQLIHTGRCEVQTPIVQPKDSANRYPDLVVLRPEHLSLVQRRLTITLDMPPPAFVMEVVSPGKTNQDRDYIRKRSQYELVGIPEYWIVNPEQQTVVVLELVAGKYGESGILRRRDQIVSSTFPALQLTAEQLFSAGDRAS